MLPSVLLSSFPRFPLSCNVHRGFYFAAQSVKVDVITWVRVLQGRLPSYVVVVTGHSLGNEQSYYYYHYYYCYYYHYYYDDDDLLYM